MLHRARDAGHTKAGMFHNLGTAHQYLGDMKAAEEAIAPRWTWIPTSRFRRRQLAGVRKYDTADEDLVATRQAPEGEGVVDRRPVGDLYEPRQGVR